MTDISPAKRAQAALEYLTTYGWALMILIVVLGALTYFGVINPQMLLPEKCDFEAGIHCQDFELDEDPSNNQAFVRAKLYNNFGRSVKIEKVEVYCSGVSSWVQCEEPDWCRLKMEWGTNDIKDFWRSDEARELVIELDAYSTADMPKVQVKITYRPAQEYFDKTAEGEIFVKPK